MNLIKLGKVDFIIDKLKRFKINEEGQLINFKVKDSVDFSESEKNIFLGENHSITANLFKEFSKLSNNAGIIIFDAHPDCLSSDDLIPSLLSSGVRKENIILVGLRKWSLEELKFFRLNKIRSFSMKELSFEGKYEVSEALMSIARGFSSLYISIDADVLDPAFVSVSVPEPGGLSIRELLFFLQRLKKLVNFKCADLSEFKEESGLVAAKVLSELI